MPRFSFWCRTGKPDYVFSLMEVQFFVLVQLLKKKRLMGCVQLQILHLTVLNKHHCSNTTRYKADQIWQCNPGFPELVPTRKIATFLRFCVLFLLILITAIRPPAQFSGKIAKTLPFYFSLSFVYGYFSSPRKTGNKIFLKSFEFRKNRVIVLFTAI